MNVVILVDKPTQARIIEHYTKYKVDRQAPGVIFSAKLPSCAITIYKSGKVMFQGSSAQLEAKRWGEVPVQAKATSSQSKGDTLPPNFNSLSVIGSDETGTGDYFGPITVAAVYVPSDKVALLETLGVKDSKMLTDDKMREMAPYIKEACTYSVLVLRNEKYNTVQQKGWSQGKIKALLHNQALGHVLKKMDPEKPQYILIDQFAERGIYYRHLANEKQVVQENVLFATKAEQLHVAVAAASILAREAFLKEMDRLATIVLMDLQKGASNKVDEMAAKIWLKFGEETLQSISKWHFANTEKARKIKNKKLGR